jgi:hypothetical protein
MMASTPAMATRLILRMFLPLQPSRALTLAAIVASFS